MGSYLYGLHLISHWPAKLIKCFLYPVTNTERTTKRFEFFVLSYLSMFMQTPLVNFSWVIFRDVSSVCVMMGSKTPFTFGKSTKRKENQFWRRWKHALWREGNKLIYSGTLNCCLSCQEYQNWISHCMLALELWCMEETFCSWLYTGCN